MCFRGGNNGFEVFSVEDQDPTGVNMALDALAQQYGVPRGKIDEYLALKE